MIWHLVFVMFLGGQQIEWTLNAEYETEKKCEAAAEQLTMIGPMLQVRGAFACTVEHRA